MVEVVVWAKSLFWRNGADTKKARGGAEENNFGESKGPYFVGDGHCKMETLDTVRQTHNEIQKEKKTVDLIYAIRRLNLSRAVHEGSA